MHLAIVIPVFNEGQVIRKVISGLPKKLKGVDKITVLAVDDGSSDNSAEEIKKTNARLFCHPINLGAGGATATGLEAAKILKADIVITMDGDGQHNPKEIAELLKPILSKTADIVIGTRLKGKGSMSISRRVGNIGLNIATLLLSGKWTSDSQSGYKALTKEALNKINLDLTGYEFCSEIIIECSKQNLRLIEIPINSIYSDYSKKKGQSALNGFNIITKLIYRKISR